MSDDLATQLREQASGDHVRGCQGRQYSCDCGYDIRGEGLLEQAATALTEARAEFERLNAQVDEALRSCLAEREGRLKAESELSALRARVREVVGPFLNIRDQFPESSKLILKKFDGFTPISITVTKDQFRAARQLDEDLK
ncbi:hypothetical protein ACWX0K_15135 [Nitrobacteraceae bacterium UC4446_H13]